MDGCMADALQIYKDMARQVRGGGEMGSGWGEVGWITDLHAPTLTLSLPRLQAIHAGHLSSHVTTLAVPSPHTQAAENHLLRFSCKQYLQAAGLCRLAQGDLSTLQDAMKTYYDIDVTFGGSREAKFIEDLLAACPQQFWIASRPGSSSSAAQALHNLSSPLNTGSMMSMRSFAPRWLAQVRTCMLAIPALMC